ncbi:MAG: hypothetical protein O4859_03130 [Trichodesmium sp. St18_bin1]|nr:hypothetical protein [Trichodesmium sp. St18_bin1]
MSNSRIEILTTQEEFKFRELVNKILAQQSLLEVLSDAEKQELFQLSQKLELLSLQLSDFSLPAVPTDKNKNKIIAEFVNFVNKSNDCYFSKTLFFT